MKSRWIGGGGNTSGSFLNSLFSWESNLFWVIRPVCAFFPSCFQFRHIYLFFTTKKWNRCIMYKTTAFSVYKMLRLKCLPSNEYGRLFGNKHNMFDACLWWKMEQKRMEWEKKLLERWMFRWPGGQLNRYEIWSCNINMQYCKTVRFIKQENVCWGLSLCSLPMSIFSNLGREMSYLLN